MHTYEMHTKQMHATQTAHLNLLESLVSVLSTEQVKLKLMQSALND